MNAPSQNAALVAVLLLGVGCGSSASRSDAATDATATTDAALDGGACNAIAQLADPVTTSCDPGAPPVAAGGTIADGTYLLTESHFFGTCESNVLSETLVIAQGTVQSITTDATTGQATRQSFTYKTTSGSATLTETQTCPGAFVATVGFSATPSRLTIFMRNPLGSRMSAFTLQ